MNPSLPDPERTLGVKAAILLKDNPDIEKCLFVVDRKDLDCQTRIESNKGICVISGD